MTVAKEEFEVDGAAAVCSTWRVEENDPLDIGDIEIDESFYFHAGRVVLDAHMTDERAARLLACLLEGAFLLRIKFLRADGGWVEDKFDPVRSERNKGEVVIEISWDTRPGAIVGIDRVYYQNSYPRSYTAFTPSGSRTPLTSNR